LQGDQGPIGLPGADSTVAGPQGIQGIQGEVGPVSTTVTLPFQLQLSLINEACVVGANKAYFVAPFNMVINDAWIDLFTSNFNAITDTAIKLTVDVKKNAVSLLTGDQFMTIDYTKNGTTYVAGVPNAVIANTAITKGERLVFDIIETPDPLVADIKGLSVTIIATTVN